MGRFDRTSSEEKRIKEFIETQDLDISVDKMQSLMVNYPNQELFFAVVNILSRNNPELGESALVEYINALSKVYDYTSSNEELYLSLVKTIARYPRILKSDIIAKISYAFSDKSLIKEVLNFLFSMLEEDNEIKIENMDNLNDIVSYLVAARKYYVDDRALFTSFINFLNSLGVNKMKYATKDEIEEIAAKFIKEDKKANGIYDIGQEELENMRQLAEKMKISSGQLETLVNLAETNISATEEVYKELKNSYGEYAHMELKKLENKSHEVLREFDARHRELINTEKRGILEDRDALVGKLESTLGDKQAELTSFINQTKMSFESDLANLRREQRGILQSIDSYIENSQALKTAMMTAKSDKEFMDKLDIVQKLADELEKKETLAKEAVVTKESSIVVPATSNIIVSPANLCLNEPIDYKVIYYFDKSTDFNKRFKKIMEKKKELADQGEIFHDAFDDILKIIMHKDVPYLYGPSGTGKTYMIENQVGRLLGINIITSGYIQHEQDVLGYRNVGNGDYVPSNFYRAFTHGDGYFFDEMDNSNAKAATILNPFFTGKNRNIYTFPDGLPTKKHPNFCIITAGNTKGEGKTIEYSSRQKLDESVLQRIWAIEVDYNNEIEKRILRDKKAWFEFAVSFRNAIESIQLSNEDTINSSGTFTTRDASDVVEYLDDDTFTYRELIKYKFIQTKDREYLSQIYAEMENFKYETQDAKKLLKEFKHQIDERAS
ncbi:MAG: AAA family ATPase [Bacilli bacterium]|nr:AAA family ATPase [Bacilli bacterium]